MIVVQFLTYNRPTIAERCIAKLKANLISPEPVWLHIADDGSEQEYRDDLFELAHKLYGENCSISNSERGGYGANYNMATQATHNQADLFLPLEDDWELVKPLDITPMINILRGGAASCVRMGYIGFTQKLIGSFISHGGLLWLLLDEDSPERHVFAGGPRLETLEFQRRLGPWPERISAGYTEFEVAGRLESRQGVVWPVDIIKPLGDYWAHIGTVPTKDAPLRETINA